MKHFHPLRWLLNSEADLWTDVEPTAHHDTSQLEEMRETEQSMWNDALEDCGPRGGDYVPHNVNDPHWADGSGQGWQSQSGRLPESPREGYVYQHETDYLTGWPMYRLVKDDGIETELADEIELALWIRAHRP